jgi:AcrR family transcriptional regulator
MSTDARREQLLEVGARLFSQRPYDEVAIGDIATEAGVSRGLMYHYFPTKQDLAVAVTQAACATVFAEAEPDAGRSIEEQLREVLLGYVAFAVEHENGFRAMHTGLVADPKVRELRAQDLAEHERRVLTAMGAPEGAPPVLVTAVRAWLAFVIRAVLDWLDQRETPRERLVDVCIATLLAAVTTARSGEGATQLG